MDVRISIIPRCLQSYTIQALAHYCTLAGLTPHMMEFNIHTIIVRKKLVYTLNMSNYEVVKMFRV